MEQPTLAEVETRFAAWRSRKQSGERIPQELWDAAVSLTSQHPVYKVSKTLRLCYTTLKKRAGASCACQPASAPVTPDFIALDFNTAVPTECYIEMEHHNGNRLRMHFTGKAELDLEFMAESFWRRN